MEQSKFHNAPLTKKLPVSIIPELPSISKVRPIIDPPQEIKTVHVSQFLSLQKVPPDAQSPPILYAFQDPAIRIEGNSHDFHNLVWQLIVQHDFFCAWQVCSHALGMGCASLDLIADAVKLCEVRRELALGESYITSMMKLGEEKWQFFHFCCVVEFLLAELKELPTESDRLSDCIYPIIQDMQRRFPDRERSFVYEALLLIQENKAEEASDKLVDWILDYEPAGRGSKSILICPWCCRYWLELNQASSAYESMQTIALLGKRYALQLGDKQNEYYFSDKLQILQQIQEVFHEESLQNKNCFQVLDSHKQSDTLAVQTVLMPLPTESPTDKIPEKNFDTKIQNPK